MKAGLAHVTEASATRFQSFTRAWDAGEALERLCDQQACQALSPNGDVGQDLQWAKVWGLSMCSTLFDMSCLSVSEVAALACPAWPKPFKSSSRLMR